MLMEINVFSPGGLSLGQKFEGVNFCYAIINALEKKIDYIKYYKRSEKACRMPEKYLSTCRRHGSIQNRFATFCTSG